ncbi:MAG: translation elongation factor Ts [Chloroflexi bacterium]|nr:translation elongation factor Ts [Chloroflexota bacterium]
MLDISASAVKDLRDKTGAGVMECKRALVEANGDVAVAMEILRRQGLAKAEKKAERAATQGVIDAYIHAGGRIGVLIEVNCETDFVARNDEFRALAHDLAMQVAATAPRYVTPEDVPAGETEEKSEVCLLLQPFIKDPGRSIQDLIKDKIAKFGENIRVRRFVRYELGA